MNHAIEVYDKCNDADSIKVLGEAIAYSGMFGCEKPEQGIVLALQCMAERKPPLELKKQYHLIHGNLSKRADAMLADFKKAGGKYKILRRDSEEAAIAMEIDGEQYEFSLTWEDAKREPFVYAGKEAEVVALLASGKTDRLKIKSKYATPVSRKQMLWARLVSDSVRAIDPGSAVGAYTPEEVSDFHSAPEGEPEIKRAEPVEQPAKPAYTYETPKSESVQKLDTSDDDDIPMEHVRDRLRPKIQPHEKTVNKWLIKNNRIKDGQTWEQLANDYLERVEKNIDAFLKACGAEVEA